MKQLNIVFEDKEYNVILQAKEKHGGNWHDYLLDVSRNYKGEMNPAKPLGDSSNSK